MIVICAWCQKPMGEKPGEPLAVSHSLCQPCYDGLFAPHPDMQIWHDRQQRMHGLTPKHLAFDGMTWTQRLSGYAAIFCLDIMIRLHGRISWWEALMVGVIVSIVQQTCLQPRRASR